MSSGDRHIGSVAVVAEREACGGSAAPGYVYESDTWMIGPCVPSLASTLSIASVSCLLLPLLLLCMLIFSVISAPLSTAGGGGGGDPGSSSGRSCDTGRCASFPRCVVDNEGESISSLSPHRCLCV